jgi:glycerol-3-phosphate dehydrogenase (NAD(P)+)
MRIAILGAGAWGTAMGIALSSRDSAAHAVTLWARDSTQATAIAAARRNERYLPEAPLPEPLRVTADLHAAVESAELVLLGTPVAGLRPVLQALRSRATSIPFVWLCKGFEEGTGLLPHQVIDEVLGNSSPPRGALSGPSFALEVAQGLPCALTLAALDAEFARTTAANLHGGAMRIYYTTDLVGVEIGGAVKNVLAIAVGISDGMGLGQNARAALVTRGLAEIQRLGVALGAGAETIMGLTGAGDLILTATGTLSRNRKVGLELAKGRSLGSVLGSLGHVAEGVRSAREAQVLAERAGIEMPITRAVNAVLSGTISPRAALQQLLSRDPRSES